MAEPGLLERRVTRSVTRAAELETPSAHSAISTVVSKPSNASKTTTTWSGDHGEHSTASTVDSDEANLEKSLAQSVENATTSTSQISTSLKVPKGFQGDPRSARADQIAKLPFKDDVPYLSILDILTEKLPLELAHLIISSLGHLPRSLFPRFGEFTRQEYEYFSGRWFFRYRHRNKSFEIQPGEVITTKSYEYDSVAHLPMLRRWLGHIRTWAFAVYVDIETEVASDVELVFFVGNRKWLIGGEECKGWEGRKERVWWLRRDDPEEALFWETYDDDATITIYNCDVKLEVCGHFSLRRVELAAYAYAHTV